MNCVSAIDRMLEADPQELSRPGASELASHLATCERCRQLAERIVAGQSELARELEAQAPGINADEALKLAEHRASAIRRRSIVWQIGAPLAAAAGIAGIVLLGDGRTSLDTPVQARVTETLPGLEVQSPPGKDVAVFAVADRPDVVVVWFFDAGDD
jgi:anti-sigma factor RsiW